MMNTKEPQTPLDDLMPNWKDIQAKALKAEKKRRHRKTITMAIIGFLTALMAFIGRYEAAALFFIAIILYDEARK
jgi:hypothetical protein